MTTETLGQNKSSLVAMSKVVGAITAMLSGLEAGVASRAAENAVENNLLPALAAVGVGLLTARRLNAFLKNPHYKGRDKMEYKVKSGDGKDTVIHYVRDPKTGRLMDFKFKKRSVD